MPLLELSSGPRNANGIFLKVQVGWSEPGYHPLVEFLSPVAGGTGSVQVEVTLHASREYLPNLWIFMGTLEDPDGKEGVVTFGIYQTEAQIGFLNYCLVEELETLENELESGEKPVEVALLDELIECLEVIPHYPALRSSVEQVVAGKVGTH